MDYAKSGSKLEEVEMLTPRGEERMPSISWPVMNASTKSLFRQTGALWGMGLLLKANTWDMIANKPKWHPEYFEFGDKEEEEVYKKYFKLLAPTIILYNNLKRRYGEYLADEITANMAIPIQLAIYPQFGWMPEDRTDIDQWRQVTADAYGNKAYECTQWVSEDKTEFRMRWTKCVPIMILKAYGLHSFAENACLVDHVYMGCLAPEVIFSRTHTIGAGDSFCDHTIRLPLSEDDKKEEADYADCLKVKGGREAVRHWEEVYKRFGEFRS
jgi:L-2-amino-thiazoline-4-carboxylic acid hydrolase